MEGDYKYTDDGRLCEETDEGKLHEGPQRVKRPMKDDRVLTKEDLVKRLIKDALTRLTKEDIALSDHSAIYCSVNVGRPTARKRLVTLRNLRAMNSADFQADIKSFAETAGDQCADPGLLDVYDTGLRQVLDRHAPLTTRRVSDWPSAPG